MRLFSLNSWLERKVAILISVILGATNALSAPSMKAPRHRLLMDFGWRFTLSNPTDAQTPDFNDSVWQTVGLPHDWSIEGEINRNNPTGAAGGFFPAGIGWYRRHFVAPKGWRGKHVAIEFEGVYEDACVWLNGTHLGFHPNGYTTFFYDLAPALKFGETNILAVRVDNSKQPNSRWYSGSGIYRHVWLILTGPMHVPHWGVCITTPEVSAKQAGVCVMTKVVNEKGTAIPANINTTLFAPNGKEVGQTNALRRLTGGDLIEVTQHLAVARPSLWSPENPQLIYFNKWWRDFVSNPIVRFLKRMGKISRLSPLKSRTSAVYGNPMPRICSTSP